MSNQDNQSNNWVTVFAENILFICFLMSVKTNTHIPISFLNRLIQQQLQPSIPISLIMNILKGVLLPLRKVVGYLLFVKY